MKITTRASWLILALLAVLATLPAAPRAAAEDAPAPAGGLLVHVGCGTGERAIEMAAQGKWLVHGLEADDAKVEAAQGRIRAKNLCGVVSIERWSGSRLPYADNLVNLLLADDARVSRTEVLRVLAPGGMARFKGETIRKPWPKEMDGWSHPRHGADGNPVSQDTLVGVPREVRWVSGLGLGVRGRPLSADGKYYLGGITCDAFNGLPLWKGSPLPRAAGDGRVYGFAGGKVVAHDATTGAAVGDFGPAEAKSATILTLEGKLVVATPGSLRVHEARTGRILWSLEVATPRVVVAGGGRIVSIEGAKTGEVSAACRDFATGKERWRNTTAGWLKDVTGCSLGTDVLGCEISPFKDGAMCTLRALSTTDGKELWNLDYKPPMGHRFQARALFLGHDLWIHKEGFTQLDPQTGKKVKSVPGGGGHCFPAIATTRYLIHGESNFTDVATGKMEANRITKGACAEDPYTPANGLLYTIPKNCICFPMLEGYMALAPAPAAAAPRAPAAWTEGGFERGPAINASWSRETAPEASEDEWPSYRHDRFRTGGTKSAAPAALTEIWRSPAVAEARPTTASLIPQEWAHNPFSQGRITGPVVAGGRVFVAEPGTHQVVALSAATGRPLWRFTANGVIDTPPTIERGRCLFGTRSGWVYCLVAATGDLVWRLRAAPEDRRIVAWGSVESAWPVAGSVLAHKGVVYFAAGRTPLADGGIHVSAAQVDSGRLVQHCVVDSFGINEWYARLAHDFDPVDLLTFDGDDALVLSRTRIRGNEVKVDADADGAFYRPGAAEAWAPVGMWSYGVSLRRQREKRPTYVFLGDTLYGGEGPTAYTPPAKCPAGGGREWNAYRVLGGFKKKWSATTAKVAALAAADKSLIVADAGGGLAVYAAADGRKAGEGKLPGPPVADGLAVAYGRLYASLEDGSVVCLGASGGTSPSLAAGPPRQARTGTASKPTETPSDEVTAPPATR
jgi:outer membrane protein assembly factor BamB